MQSQNLPIGYYIRQADEMLTKGIDEIQSAFNMTRTDWQIINSISKKSALEKSYLIELMKSFADTAKVESVLARLENEKLVKSDDGINFTLTQKGQELYKECFGRQQSFRHKAMKGIAGEEYEATIKTLKKIIENISKAG